MLRIDDTQQGQLVSAYITDALGPPMQLVTPNGHPRWLAEPDDWAAVKTSAPCATSPNRSGSRASGTMKRVDFTITVTGIMTRSKAGILVRIR